MSARSAPNVVVFSCDENYVPLARGLVLSLGEIGVPDADTDLLLIDIGCSAPSLDWMRERSIRVVSFDASLLPPAVLAAIGPQQRAQAIRPWIPDLLPDHAAYIWFD